MIRGLLFGSGVLFGPGGDQSAFCSGSAGTTAISSLQLRSGGDHCDLELAVEARRRRKELEGGGRKSRADIRSSNPHLTGEGKW